MARLRGPRIVFLGLEEPQGTTASLPPSAFSDKTEAPEVVAERIIGTPYFSLDVSDIESSALDPLLQNDELAKDGNQLKFSEGRAALLSMSPYEAAVFAEARSMVDWNARNRVRSNLTHGYHRGLIYSISSVHPVVHPCTLSGLGGSSPARPPSHGK